MKYLIETTDVNGFIQYWDGAKFTTDKSKAERVAFNEVVDVFEEYDVLGDAENINGEAAHGKPGLRIVQDLKTETP